MSDASSVEQSTHANGGSRQAIACMISLNQSVITGGIFHQTNVHHSRSPFQQLQDQVAHSAFHNSAQYTDAPRCHPNTRVAVKGKAYHWITGTDSQSANALILWLNGPAGAGKSAIAQSIAEQCHVEKHLLASFFFSRLDPLRNHAKNLVATLVYQIYLIVPPPAQDSILQAIQRDPLIWSRDIFTQFHVLVVNTLRDLIQSGYFHSLHAPRVIIFDGLDECIEQMTQQRVLELMLKAVHEWRLPFLLLVASRPEPAIQAVFDRPLMASVYHHISLDQEDVADPDIELFIRDKLSECKYTHPSRRYIPSNWPMDDDIAALVQKSSGQFIYASVVVKYVTSVRHLPHQRLQTVFQLRPTTQSPYSELDAIYSQILLAVQDLPLVRRILGIFILFRMNVKTIEEILRLEEGEVCVALADINSLVSLRQQSPWSEVLHFHHASLEDYLFDASRSQGYHINASECHHECLKYFISFMMDSPVIPTYRGLSDVFFALPKCLSSIDLDSGISEYILSNFSLASVHRRLWRMSPELGVHFYSYILSVGLSDIFVVLHSSPSQNSTRIIQHLIRGFDDILEFCLSLYPKSIQLDFNCALIALLNEPSSIPCGALHQDLRLDWKTPLASNRPDIGLKFFDSDHFHRHYIPLLSVYLCTPTRSKVYAVSGQIFSNAAEYCLEYLCDHSRIKQSRTPSLDSRLSLMRKTHPWRWRQRRAADKARGWRETAWMWVAYFWDMNKEPTTVLRPKRYRVLYAHEPHTPQAYLRLDCNPAVVETMIRHERYWLGLHYLPLFLSRADYSDTLVEMCRTKVFASRSQEFSGKSRRARAAIKEYITRLGYVFD